MRRLLSGALTCLFIVSTLAFSPRPYSVSRRTRLAYRTLSNTTSLDQSALHDSLFSTPISSSYLRVKQANTYNGVAQKQQTREYDWAETYDTIVIGSGIGGLAVASLLVQCQKPAPKVLVLDGDGSYEQSAWQAAGYEFSQTGRHIQVGTPVLQLSNLTDTLALLDLVTPALAPVQWSSRNVSETFLFGNLHDTKLERHDVTNEVVGDQQLFTGRDRRIYKRITKAYDKILAKTKRSGQRGIAFKYMPKFIVNLLLKTNLYSLFDKKFTTYSQLTVEDVVDELSRVALKRRGSKLFGDTNNATKTVFEACFAQLSNEKVANAYMYSRYDTSIGKASWLLYSLVVQQSLKNADRYPLGGVESIYKSVGKVIRARGGILETHDSNAKVKQILFDDRQAIGVQLYNGTRIHANNIVSNLGYHSTFNDLIPLQYRPPAVPLGEPQAATRKMSMTVYVGLPGDQHRWKLPKQPLCLFPTDGTASTTNLPLSRALQMPKFADTLSPIHIHSPSCLDPTWSVRYPYRSVIEVSVDIPTTWTNELSGTASASHTPVNGERHASSHDKVHDIMTNGFSADFHTTKVPSSVKDRLAQTVWSRARQALLNVGASIQLPVQLESADYHRVAIRDYTVNDDSINMSPLVFWSTLRAAQRVPNLYLTGSDVVFGRDIAADLSGAYLCAASILRVRPEKLIERVQQVNRVRYDIDAITAYRLLDKSEAVHQGEHI